MKLRKLGCCEVATMEWVCLHIKDGPPYMVKSL